MGEIGYINHRVGVEIFSKSQDKHNKKSYRVFKMFGRPSFGKKFNVIENSNFTRRYFAFKPILIQNNKLLLYNTDQDIASTPLLLPHSKQHFQEMFSDGNKKNNRDQMSQRGRKNTSTPF
jgi:hypothetical protein